MADVSDRIVADMKGRTDEEFLARVFAIFFEQQPDKITSTRTIERLARGAWRRDVVDSLIASGDFAKRYLQPGLTMEQLRDH